MLMRMHGRNACRFLVCAIVAMFCIALAVAQESSQQTQMTGPFTGPFTAPQAEAGRAIYQATCSSCHLPNMRGTFRGAAARGRKFS